MNWMIFWMIDRSRESGISKQWTSHTDQWIIVEYTEYKSSIEHKLARTHTERQKKKTKMARRSAKCKMCMFNLIRTLFFSLHFFFLIKNKFENKMRKIRIKNWAMNFGRTSFRAKRMKEIARIRNEEATHRVKIKHIYT